MVKGLKAPAVASSYDTSKGISILSEADKSKMISSQKASRVEDEVIDDEVIDDEQDGYKQTPGVEDFPKKKIELDEYDDNAYQMQPLTFPASKNDGAELCLERLDYMTKQVDRLRCGQPTSPKTPFGRTSESRRTSTVSRADVSFNSEAESLQDNTLEAYEESMEKALFECCQPQRSDYRLLELLGSQGQNMLQMGQLKIVEYFRYKYAMMDQKSAFGNSSKDAIVPDADGEPSSSHDMPELPESDGRRISSTENPLKGLTAQSPERSRGSEESSLDGGSSRRGSMMSMMSNQGQGHGRRRLASALGQVEESAPQRQVSTGSQLSTQSMQKLRASRLQRRPSAFSENPGSQPSSPGVSPSATPRTRASRRGSSCNRGLAWMARAKEKEAPPQEELELDDDACLPSSSDQEARKAGRKGSALSNAGKIGERAGSALSNAGKIGERAGSALSNPGKIRERAPSKGPGSKTAKKLPPLPIKKRGPTQRS